MKRGESKSRSQRQLRVGEVIRHALAQTLERGEAHDPGLAGVSITVTEVRISPDLRNATAFVMPLGGVDAGPVLESLNRAAPFFRRRIAAEIDMRRLPALSFQLDDSFDNASHIDSLLRSPAVAADVEADPDNVSRSGDDGP
ncbi:MAG: 30S ribosome-binding factor RbfA [Alphaproteobacteria bacterium]